MLPSVELRRFEYDGWSVVIELDGCTSEGVSSGHADLDRRGGHRCTIALAGKYPNAAAAMTALSDRSRAFVDEWDIKRGEGESPFIDQ
ncbi:hypothetical protein [Variovorax sp. J31P207]|uniref:hypothetical protein n=1 Tax=Variovorax sp. J31P207 TaxID=3053510 RepID=UPI0025790134|nr:hypothetical protein [Variovorax sp. J31P207]MDM0072309.1 hypothetical protein [Variovorax sp. J31P207]